MIWPFNKERRQWPRREVRLDVMYGSAPPLTLTTSVDMSNHSLAFKSSKAYDLGTRLEIQVLVDPAHPDAGWFYAEGKVARSGTGIVAVEFIKVSSADAHKLDSFFLRLAELPLDRLS